MPTPLRASDYLVMDGAQIGRDFMHNYLARKEYDRRKAEDENTLQERKLLREQQATEGQLNRDKALEVEDIRNTREDLRQQSYFDRVMKQQEGMDRRNTEDNNTKKQLEAGRALGKIGASLIDWMAGKGKSGRGDGLGRERLSESQKLHANNATISAFKANPANLYSHELIADEDGVLKMVPKAGDAVVPPNAGPGSVPGTPSNDRFYEFDAKGLRPKGADGGSKPINFDNFLPGSNIPR
jgi:hypothetical protein